jgi:hypothetical protein
MNKTASAWLRLYSVINSGIDDLQSRSSPVDFNSQAQGLLRLEIVRHWSVLHAEYLWKVTMRDVTHAQG